MGKSRSATIVCAYLMWKYGVSPKTALEQLCEGRPVCEPNPGFQEQLKVYERMLKEEDEGEKKEIYGHWIKNRYTGTWYSGESKRSYLSLFLPLLLLLLLSSSLFMELARAILVDYSAVLIGHKKRHLQYAHTAANMLHFHVNHSTQSLNQTAFSQPSC